jgi:hypothetical protein
MAVGEAILFFDRKLAEDFDYRCKQAGQLASKMRFLPAPWIGLMENGAWLKNATHANTCARYFAVIDVQSLTVTKTYPVDRCLSPHSLAIDASSHRLFVGCLNASLAVVDADSGKVVAHQLACGGVDAGGFDPEKKLVFLSCAEGVVSVIHQVSPDNYELVDTVKTELWARTMAFDSVTKRIFLPTADMESVAGPDPSQPPVRRVTPGSFRILVVSP